jgi:hypothetical protein
VSLPLRLRIALALLRLRLLYGWRRSALSVRTPVELEPDTRGAPPAAVPLGAIYRPAFGSQFGDPTEAHSSPHSEGANCTMAAAGMALGYHRGGSTVRAGDMRHRQGDQDGGTDLYDAAEAWAHYGETLSIRSGQGWPKVAEALRAGRGVILQGTGGLAGCGNYDGPHAVYVQPEASGSRWLKGDPECSGWEWTEAHELERFAERLSSGVYFAVTADRTSAPAPIPPPEPAPEPAPCLDCPDPLQLAETAGAIATERERDRAVGEWLDWLEAGEPMPVDRWDVGAWDAVQRSLGELLLATDCELDPAAWSRGPLPDPVAAALHALATPARWDAAGWRSLAWA